MRLTKCNASSLFICSLYAGVITFLSVALSFPSPLQHTRRSWRARLIVLHSGWGHSFHQCKPARTGCWQERMLFVYLSISSGISSLLQSTPDILLIAWNGSLSSYQWTKVLYSAWPCRRATLATQQCKTRLIQTLTNTTCSSQPDHWPLMAVSTAVTELSRMQVWRCWLRCYCADNFAML